MNDTLVSLSVREQRYRQMAIRASRVIVTLREEVKRLRGYEAEYKCMSSEEADEYCSDAAIDELESTTDHSSSDS